MRTPWIWSVSLGRWWNVHVRLHMMFFIFAAFMLYVISRSQPPSDWEWLYVGVPLTFLLSVLLHEIAHVVIARRLGGLADEIVIAPLGGLSTVRVPYEPHSELVASMAGILANAAVCFLTCVMIGVYVDPTYDLVKLLQPDVSFLRFDDPSTQEMGGASTYEWSPLSVLKLVFWVNWSLLLINLLPVYPFDGGRALNSVLSFLWPEVEAKQSHIVICRLGKVLAAVGVVVAFLYFRSATAVTDPPQPPLWLVLLALSIYVFFNSRREELQQAETEQEEDTVFGYDFSQGYTSLERSSDDDQGRQHAKQNGLIGSWLERRRQAQEQRLLEQEAEDERRVDEVLQRLHEQGMRNLSADDKALLNRVSERYRSRQD